jgi:hypothetical protein
MSISTSGEQRRPSVVAGKKAVAGGKPADDKEKSPSDSSGSSGSSGSSSSSGSSGSSTKGASAKTPAAKAGSKGATKAAGAKGAAPKSAAAKSAAAKSAAAKSAAARTAAAKSAAAKGAKSGGAKTAGKPGGPRRPITPVKVSQGRSWGPIALFTAVGLLAAGIIGWGAWAVYQNGRSWEDRASSISGIVNYREKDPGMLTQNHKTGQLQYKVSPPVGGDHNPTWERCQGDVYDAQVPNENAVHSMEHGAVWITYQPDLAKDQVDKLASKVHGNDFMLMSPYPGLDKPISLQAWGYQLKVDNANDGRIDDFIKALRENASKEPGTPCSSGNYTTGTGTTPRDLTDQQDTSGQTGS